MPKPFNRSAQIEATLFIQNTPVSQAKLAKLLNLTSADVETGLLQLQQDLKGRGVQLITSSSGYELVATPGILKDLPNIQTEAAPQLSQSSLEVLAIIAYDGPVEKLSIDSIRGVASDSSLRALMSRDLIVQLKATGESGPRYELTSQAWQHLGLRGRSDLPAKPKVKATDATE